MTTVNAGEVWSISVTVTDSAGNTRTFDAGTQTVQGIAPTATTAPTITGTVAPGETVTLNEGTYTGTTPITITFTLTLDGVDVTGDVTSNSYTIPAGTDGQSLVYTETASNGIAPDATQSVSETVASPAVAYDAKWIIDPVNCAANVDGTGAVAVGDTVAYLEDVSGNGVHLTNSTTADQWILRQGADSLYYLEIDGAGDNATATIPSLDLTAGSFSIFGGDLPNTGSGFIFRLSDQLNPADSRLIYAARLYDRREIIGFDNATNIRQQTAPQGRCLSSVNNSGTSIQVRENGANQLALTSPGAPASNATEVSIYTFDATASSRFYGGGLLLREATTQEVTDAEAEFAALTGVTLP